MKKLLSLLLALTLCLGLSTPACAYYMTAEGKPIADLKTQEFTSDNISRFQGLGSTVLPKTPCTIEQSVLLCYRIYTMMIAQ